MVLTFLRQGSVYAVPGEAVLEIVALPALSSWPGAPEGVAGVLDYHGEVVPAIDLAAYLTPSLAQCGVTESSQLILVVSGGQRLALLADQALELQAETEFRPLSGPLPPGMQRVLPYLQGLAASDQQVILQLDLVALAGLNGDPPPTLVAPPSPSDILATRACQLALPWQPLPELSRRQVVLVGLGEEHFGIAIEEVAELALCPPISPVPGTPDHLLGLAYHRGDLLRLVDLRPLCALPRSDAPRDYVVVLRGPGMTTGLAVDRIEGVIELEPGDEAGRHPFSGGWLRLLDLERLPVREPNVPVEASE